MADLFHVARPIPSPANAILLDIDKEKGLGLLINAVFKLCTVTVGVILVGHSSKPLRELPVKYGKNCRKLCEPVTGWAWKKWRKPSLDANWKTMSTFRDVTLPLSLNSCLCNQPCLPSPARATLLGGLASLGA